ncbi:DUF6390 family protein [Aldersonia sp. NBC_00410]|uniref:DUF6390 family protein n=1 Tax=Aldersonia sp. NBC_00410 TaxID=2975954 RepID=UPI0022528EED|nr:DUF6390 family protein [Aldersonia sp. NBC_00410]MCX5042144.1 DUF6390 family protein [Aldersonia sp. NBC_00410]
MGTSLREGHELFARYAFPPNELGYCGPESASLDELADRAREFDGAWPYLEAIAAAIGTEPLDPAVVRTYWVGSPLLDDLDPGVLLARLRAAFAGQATGLLADVPTATAHHSFHVCVVYPWVRFLGRGDPATPLRVLQSCRIRWGTVQHVSGDELELVSSPLVYDGRRLELGAPAPEVVRWRKGGSALTAAPAGGDVVAAHWDWVCGRLGDADAEALECGTAATLDLVNRLIAEG